MNLFQAYFLLIFLSVRTSEAVPNYARPGCNDTCGNVTIPYPFGIGANCAINNWYVVECNSSTPYLSSLNHLQVIGVDLSNQTVTVNTPTVTTTLGCQNHVQDIKSVNLGESPFWFSSDHNKLVLEGCGNVVFLDNGNVLSGCSSNCVNDTTINEKNNCLGITCCQTTVPYHLKSYAVKLTGGDRSCGSAFFVDENSYVDEGRFGNISEVVPVSLIWTLSELDKLQTSCCKDMYGGGFWDELGMGGNGTELDSWICWMPLSYEGNPYLKDGCVVTEECARCRQSGNYCDYDNPAEVLNCTSPDAKHKPGILKLYRDHTWSLNRSQSDDVS